MRVNKISTFGSKNSITVVEEDTNTNWYSLKTILSRQVDPFSEEVVCSLACQLLNSIKHIHDLGIVHGAIYLENVMSNRPILDSSACKFKLVNFDNARILPTGKLPANFLERDLQSSFVSPELEKQDLTKFGIASDIWSFGVLIYTMLTR